MIIYCRNYRCVNNVGGKCFLLEIRITESGTCGDLQLRKNGVSEERQDGSYRNGKSRP